MSSVNTNDTAAQTAVTSTLSVLVVTGFIGNTLVILIILTNKSMKSPMNYLLVNLAVADIITGLFLTPRFILMNYVSHPEGIQGNIFCRLLTGGNFAWVGIVASSFSLVAVSFERYNAVVHPLSSNPNRGLRRFKAIIVACWVFAFVMNLPLFLTKIYNERYKTCAGVWPKEPAWLEGLYFMFWSIVNGAMPLVIILVLYSRIVHTLWFKRPVHQFRGTQLAMLKSRKKVTKIVLIVSVLYAVFSSPDLVIHFIIFSGIQSSTVKTIHLGCVILLACNSAINPFIYTLQSRKFRRCLKKLFACRKFCQNHLYASFLRPRNTKYDVAIAAKQNEGILLRITFL